MFGDDNKKAPRLRLLKVMVQPVMVVDDGESLQEVAVDPIQVPANEWPTYATGRFQEQVKALQEQLETSKQPAQTTAQPAVETKAQSEEKPEASSF